MDLLKHYGAKELARITFNEIKYRRNKERVEVDSFLFEKYKRFKNLKERNRYCSKRI